jgi:hypothetical protein
MRKHLTYANVMATLAVVLVVAGGTAYAANTVFSTDIVNGEVKSVDIGTNQVRSVDIQNEGPNGGGLTSADLAEDSVGAHQFQYGVLQSHARTWVGSTATNADTEKELQVSCPLAANGEEVTGGGYVISNNGVNVPSVVVQRSYAVDEHTWLVRAIATSGTPTWGLTVVANCIQ